MGIPIWDRYMNGSMTQEVENLIWQLSNFTTINLIRAVIDNELKDTVP